METPNTKHPEDRELLRDALTTLRYIAYGDALEGIRPSNPQMEADLAVKRIQRRLEAASEPVSSQRVSEEQECQECGGEGERTYIIDGSRVHSLCEGCGGDGIEGSPPCTPSQVEAEERPLRADAVRGILASKCPKCGCPEDEGRSYLYWGKGHGDPPCLHDWHDPVPESAEPTTPQQGERHPSLSLVTAGQIRHGGFKGVEDERAFAEYGEARAKLTEAERERDSLGEDAARHAAARNDAEARAEAAESRYRALREAVLDHFPVGTVPDGIAAALSPSALTRDDLLRTEGGEG